MTLIKCEECGKEFSDTVRRCPHCGMKNNKKKLNIDLSIKDSVIGIINNKGTVTIFNKIELKPYEVLAIICIAFATILSFFEISIKTFYFGVYYAERNIYSILEYNSIEDFAVALCLIFNIGSILAIIFNKKVKKNILYIINIVDLIFYLFLVLSQDGILLFGGYLILGLLIISIALLVLNKVLFKKRK